MAPVINVADQAIAQTALTEVLAASIMDVTSYPDREQAALHAAFLLGKASKVRFQPSTRQLVLTFDLAFNSGEPDTSGPVQ